MGGDSGTVRTGARAFVSAATEISSIIDNLDGTIASILGYDWQNMGSASFGSAWNDNATQIQSLASSMSDFGNQLNSVADKIDHLNHLEDLLHGFEIAAAVGVGLTFFTFGISDAEAAAAAAAAATTETEIALAGEALDAEVTGVLESILSQATRVITTFAVRFAVGGVAWGGTTAAGELVFTGHVDWGTVLANTIAGGLSEGLIPASGPVSFSLVRQLMAQGWLEGTLVTSYSQAQTNGGNPLSWDWGAIDLNALETALGNAGGGVTIRIAGTVVHSTVVPHLPPVVQAKVPGGVPYVPRHAAPK